MTAVVVIEAVVIVLLLILVAGLLKSHAEILRQLHRLGATEDQIGAGPAASHPSTGLTHAPATEISGVDPLGAVRVVTIDHGRGSTLLAFLSSGCASCQVFWDELGGDHDLPRPDTRVVIVTKGSSSESPSRISELAPEGMPLVMSDKAWDLFRVPVAPYFIHVDENGVVVGEGSATSWARLLKLLRRAEADSRHPARLDTREREHFTDTRITGAGIDPGDPALYDNPLDQ